MPAAERPHAPRGPVTDGLRDFWDAALLPADVRPYLEFQARRYGHIVEALAALAPFDSKRVLDLGGGAGSLDVVLHRQFGGTYDLAEFVPPAAAHRAALATRGVQEYYRLDLTAPQPLAGLPDGYDLLLFVEVLEHLLVNPLLLFREFWNHLKPGGYLFLTTPNQSRLRNRFRLLLGRSIKETGRFPLEAGRTFGHVLEYGRAELDQLLGVEGFEPVERRVVQQLPSMRPSRVQRLAVAALNSRALRRWELGDDILGLYRKVERPLVRVRDASGRI
ncbi:MAG TPA: class I SAM-dependent methyltransferase [Thermoplasmata archaeon]|nr:class I SAM-dependent methyltransferase [Thermoplasmata archaeon]